MTKQIFKKGDRVYSIFHGWVKVLDTLPGNEFINVELEDKSRNFWTGIKILSFTEYTLDGFSQERPEELPKRGDIVWIRDADCDPWFISHFMKKVGTKYYCSDTMSEDGMTDWYQLTTKNPYADGK